MIRNNASLYIVACAALLALCACSTQQEPEPEVKPVYPINNDGFYEVQDGDTLLSIAQHFGRSEETLLCWNPLPNKNILQVGQQIRVMPYKGKDAYLCLNLPVKTKFKDEPVRAKEEKSQTPVSARPVHIGVQPIWPIRGTVSKSFNGITQKGIDISGKAGNSVKAVADGVVIYAGEELEERGQMIVLRHNQMLMTTYSNNRQLLVGVGQQVKKGQAIALMGQGKDGRGLLHFEMMLNNNPINPVDYLPK